MRNLLRKRELPQPPRNSGMAFRNSEPSKSLVSQAKAFVSKSGDRERARESQREPERVR